MKKLLLLLCLCLPSWGTACLSSWSNAATFCQPLVIQSGQITGTLTNPTYDFCLGSSINANCNTNTKQLATTGNGGNLQNGSGFDFIFTSDQAGTTALKYCRIIQNITTGVAQIKIKVPSAADGTTIYMFTGNSAITTDQSDCANAYDANTLAAWSLPDGTTLSGTGFNALNLTNHSATAAAGQLDGAANFVSGQYLEQTSTSALQLGQTQPFTISTWVFPIHDFIDEALLSNLDAGGGTYRGWEFVKHGNLSFIGLQFFFINTYPSNYIYIVGTDTQPINTWGKWTVTYDGSSSSGGFNFYINDTVGAFTVVASTLSATTTNSQPTRVGIRTDGTTPFEGLQDEITIDNVARSQAWVFASSKNQTNNIGFWALGTQVMAPGGTSFVANPTIIIAGP